MFGNTHFPISVANMTHAPRNAKTRSVKYLRECSSSRFIAVMGFFLSIPAFLVALMLAILLKLTPGPALTSCVMLGVGVLFCVLSVMQNVYHWRVEKARADDRLPVYETQFVDQKAKEKKKKRKVETVDQADEDSPTSTKKPKHAESSETANKQILPSQTEVAGITDPAAKDKKKKKKKKRENGEGLAVDETTSKATKRKETEETSDGAQNEASDENTETGSHTEKRKHRKKRKKEKNEDADSTRQILDNNTDDAVSKKQKKKHFGKDDSDAAENGSCSEHAISTNSEQATECCKKKKKKKKEKDVDETLNEDAKGIVCEDVKEKKKKHKSSKGKSEKDSCPTENGITTDNVEGKHREKSCLVEREVISGEEPTKKKKSKKGDKVSSVDVESNNTLETSGDSEVKKKRKRDKKSADENKQEMSTSDKDSDTSKSGFKSADGSSHPDNHENTAKDSSSANHPKKEKATSETPRRTFGQWNTTMFESSDRQEKFLRLLGGMKKGSTPGPAAGGKKGLFGSLKASSSPSVGGQSALAYDQAQIMNRRLESDFERALAFRGGQRGVGLGFQPDPAEGKKFHIDIHKSASKKFDD
nr:hypothetical protein BaRGS_002532 [Batillaria attramentaria]